MANDDNEVSTEGLDDFSRQFLFSIDEADSDGNEEFVKVQDGQQISSEALKKYQERRKEEFIERAGAFTEDLIGFVMEQKQMRGLSDVETIFALALSTINFRHAYGSKQGNEEEPTPEKRKKLLKEFDAICYGAQQYWDAHNQ